VDVRTDEPPPSPTIPHSLPVPQGVVGESVALSAVRSRATELDATARHGCASTQTRLWFAWVQEAPASHNLSASLPAATAISADATGTALAALSTRSSLVLPAYLLWPNTTYVLRLYAGYVGTMLAYASAAVRLQTAARRALEVAIAGAHPLAWNGTDGLVLDGSASRDLDAATTALAFQWTFEGVSCFGPPRGGAERVRKGMVVEGVGGRGKGGRDRILSSSIQG